MFFSKATSAFLTASALLLGSPVWASCSNNYLAVNDRPNEPNSYSKQLLGIIQRNYTNKQYAIQRYLESRGILISKCLMGHHPLGNISIPECRTIVGVVLDSENNYPKNDFTYIEDENCMIEYLDDLRDSIRATYWDMGKTSNFNDIDDIKEVFSHIMYNNAFDSSQRLESQ